MQPTEIPVEWQMEDPPLPPQRWHRWTARDIEAAAASTDEILDDRLGWPRGSTGALVVGFEQGYSRALGWESDDEEFGPAIRAAALVFKRGIGFRRDSGSISGGRQRQGRYVISIHADAPDFANLVGSAEFPIIDGNVLRAWPAQPASARCLAMTLDEHEKNLQSVALILDTWRAAGQPKVWTVIGGGLLTDVTAFAAALVHCDLRLIPTTLLAMADACLGGKTGVNFAPYGKNQVGAFHFPSRVDVWVGWFTTRPPRQLRAGAMECIKHAFLSGDLALAAAIAHAIHRNQTEDLTLLLPRIIQVKSDVVSEDPGENGKRAILNLGHTLAHALETFAHERTTGETTILHGEALGVGLAYALLLSREIAGLAVETLESMLALLHLSDGLISASELARRIGVPSLDDDEIFSKIWALTAHDKKNIHGSESVNFVLLHAPGHIARGRNGEWTLPVTIDAARKTWDELLPRLR